MSKHYYNNGIVAIKLEEGSEIPEGFVKGNLKSKIKYVYYTDGTINLRVPEGTVVPDNYYKGRVVKWSEESKKSRLDKAKKTCLERYGDENYNNMEKNKNTKLIRYGNENYRNDNKIKQTCLEKYGSENPFGSDIIKDKIRNTNIERYGYSYSFQNSNILEKAYKNSWTDNARRSRVETFNERYGINGSGTYFSKPSIKDSKPNLLFKESLENNGFVVDDSCREVYINKYFYDFYVNNTLIEINPTVTHNSTYSIYGESQVKDKEYHFNKSKVARDSGYRCIHVWDWDDLDKIVCLLEYREKVFARNCEVKEVSTKDSKEFINNYHLQGYARSNINIGLYYKDSLISIMTFGKPRYNKKFEYELIRYCSSHNVVGGAERLFKYFIRNYKPSSIISYCDYSKFNGTLYEKLGFSYNSVSIGKHWYNEKLKIHITDNLLRQRGFDQLLGKQFGCYGKGTSNEQLMLEHGFVEIYDAGQAVYSWKNINDK